MVLSLRREPESARDIVGFWIDWFAALGRGSRSHVVFLAVFLLGLGAVVIWAHGLRAFLVFTLLFFAALFAAGPFGEVYQSTRIAWRWRREAPARSLPGGLLVPSRRRLLMAGFTVVALTALGVLGCWLFLGYGWNTVPVVDRFSPWTVLLLPVICLAFSEAMVAGRVHAEFRRRLRAETRDLAAFNANLREQPPSRQP